MRNLQSTAPRLVMAAAAGLALSAVSAAAAEPRSGDGPYPAVSTSVEAVRLDGTDVYYVQGEPAVPSAENEGFTSNAGFVVTEEGVVVLDALGTPSLGYELLREIREVTDAPVEYVVASHYHADHIYGFQAFAEHTDAEILAQERAKSYMSGEAEARLAQRREALAPWVNEDTFVVAPDEVFAESRTLELGGKRIEILYAGPAHAPDDVMMLVQPDGVLFAGDIVQSQRVPFLASPEVSTERWLAALTRAHEMQPRFIVPGHGAPSADALEAIEFTQGYIRHVRDVMGAAVQDWIPFEEAYAAADWSAYEGLPAFEASHKRNTYRVYLEIERAQLE